MLIAGLGVAFLLLAAWWRPKLRMQPLKRADLRRMRRLSEKVYREDSFPFD
ncbi:MAG: hypothetical protein ACLQKA_16990 [Bryobacteraceae bacterium]